MPGADQGRDEETHVYFRQHQMLPTATSIRVTGRAWFTTLGRKEFTLAKPWTFNLQNSETMGSALRRPGRGTQMEQPREMNTVQLP